MKKLLSLAAVCLFVVALCACGSANTPEGVTEKALKCMISKDYQGYVDLMHFQKEKSSEDMQQIVALVKDKMDKEIDKKEGIKDYKIGTPEVTDDKAVVPYTLTYGNGETKEDKMKLVKTEDGKWMIDSGK
jgi:hypothetical protein